MSGVDTSLSYTWKNTLKHLENTAKTYILVNPSNIQTILPN
jgi:hypothetical protein